MNLVFVDLAWLDVTVTDGMGRDSTVLWSSSNLLASIRGQRYLQGK